MKRSPVLFPVVLLTALLATLALACDFEEENKQYACSYEESRTDGCDGQGFGPYIYECFDFYEDDYNISPSEVCGNVTQPGLFCEANCCIDYRYQNVDLSEGSCGGGG